MLVVPCVRRLYCCTAMLSLTLISPALSSSAHRFLIIRVAGKVGQQPTNGARRGKKGDGRWMDWERRKEGLVQFGQQISCLGVRANGRLGRRLSQACYRCRVVARSFVT
ncbi:hypothetical protein F5B18DRAFT_601905 [Nemania serpens]|nr:hypothetical protein F5B18DRAFT_601905 [Nemania serpens]